MTILCLVIIIMANSIQLKFVIKNGRAVFNQFYSAQIGLGVTSVLLASFVGKIFFSPANIKMVIKCRPYNKLWCNDEFNNKKILVLVLNQVVNEYLENISLNFFCLFLYTFICLSCFALLFHLWFHFRIKLTRRAQTVKFGFYQNIID